MTTTFDSETYETTTRAQCPAAAEQWHRWGPTLGSWLGEATQLMLDMAGVHSGSRVLDMAAGTGQQSLVAARRVGSQGHFRATDIAPNLLVCTRKDAQFEGADGFEGPCELLLAAGTK